MYRFQPAFIHKYLPSSKTWTAKPAPIASWRHPNFMTFSVRFLHQLSMYYMHFNIWQQKS